MMEVKRVFVEKKAGFDQNARHLLQELQNFLGISGLKNLRLLNRYDLELEQGEAPAILETVFPETIAETIYFEKLPLTGQEFLLTKEYLPGQFDPKIQGLSHLLKLLSDNEQPLARTGEIMLLDGNLSRQSLQKINNYWLNPLEAREANQTKPTGLKEHYPQPQPVPLLEYFIYHPHKRLVKLHRDLGLAMSIDDLVFCQEYFRNRERRNPSITEIRIIDTYWSDHCRHKTFFTPLEEIEISPDASAKPIRDAFQAYLESRAQIPKLANKDLCLMDLALIGMRELKEQGLLEDLDESEEVNAASIKIEVSVDGVKEDWLLMFKNETHNHPTEIEPRGGAATCLGGAIRDPLSGRSYVYQAMRVTGSGDPRASYKDTLPGKLPQRQITKEAALGYSYYGNQIGVPAGQVAEFYHDGFLAKRMELGAVIAAAPQENVRRSTPKPGDYVLLLGNKTGRDGCGGAAGSSKEHVQDDDYTLIGTEVPKGNPPEERKLIRLFRNPEAAKLIKKCNDFGAGGVSVAIGELADGLNINLNAVPLAYPGLDGTEIAISESQERMAVVISPENVKTFIQLARKENVSAAVVAEVAGGKRVKMNWHDDLIVDLERRFLDTGGVKDQAKVKINPIDYAISPFNKLPSLVEKNYGDLKAAWLANLEDLNVCSQKPLMDLFDSTAGGGTVIAPYGGREKVTPAEGMVAKIPLLKGETTTGSIMTFGYNPEVSDWSPFHGGLYAVIEAVAKSVALGGNHRKIRMSFQEYFERLEQDPEKWGKPFSALLGAYLAQKNFLIPAIGGKDSMSGSWQEINVPPTLVAFSVATTDITKVISSDFKQPGSQILLIPTPKDEQEMPDFNLLNRNFTVIHQNIRAGRVLAAGTVKTGGLAALLSQMAFGNKLGLEITEKMNFRQLFSPNYGSMVLELPADSMPDELFGEINYQLIGKTKAGGAISLGDTEIPLEGALAAWKAPLKEIFSNEPLASIKIRQQDSYPLYQTKTKQKASVSYAKPRVLIPVFVGTNGEYEGAKAFERAGALVETLVFRDLSRVEANNTIQEFAKKLKESQILMLPGGVSGWDEPERAGKYGAQVLWQPLVQEAVLNFLEKEGLILGIGNGFQILLNTGLLPYGKYRQLTNTSPLLVQNHRGQYVADYVRTKVVSNLSPWFNKLKPGEEFLLPLSCYEGRFVGSEGELLGLFETGQVASTYLYNPTGSDFAIEGITSPDGRILGKMAHSERWSPGVAINLTGNKQQDIFGGAVEYFSK